MDRPVKAWSVATGNLRKLSELSLCTEAGSPSLTCSISRGCFLLPPGSPEAATIAAEKPAPAQRNVYSLKPSGKLLPSHCCPQLSCGREDTLRKQSTQKPGFSLGYLGFSRREGALYQHLCVYNEWEVLVCRGSIVCITAYSKAPVLAVSV